MRNLFEQFNAGWANINDPFVVWLNVIGLFLIAVGFGIFGILCVSMADYPVTPPKTKRAIILTRLIGWFLIACAFARLIDLIGYWHNFAIFNGWLRVLTGILTFIAMSLVPSVIRETKQSITMKEAAHKLDKTKEKLQQVEDLSRKLDHDDTITS